jgi:hypothetical protein
MGSHLIWNYRSLGVPGVPGVPWLRSLRSQLLLLGYRLNTPKPASRCNVGAPKYLNPRASTSYYRDFSSFYFFFSLILLTKFCLKEFSPELHSATHSYRVKYPLIWFQLQPECTDKFQHNSPVSMFVNALSAVRDFYHVDRPTAWHTELNSPPQSWGRTSHRRSNQNITYEANFSLSSTSLKAFPVSAATCRLERESY